MKLTNDLTVSKWCSLSPDKDSDEAKTFKIELLIPSGTTVNDMASAILKTSVITWQNAKRPKYDKLIDKSTHKLTFKRPVSEVDPEDAMVAKLQAMDTDEQRLAYLNDMMKKAK